MPVQNDHAFVLRLTEYSEASQIATLFTRGAGLVRLIAKGTRRGTKKRPGIGLDLLEFGELAYVPARGEAGLGTLAEWVLRDAFSAARRHLARLYSGLYAAEAVSMLTQEHDPHPALFDALLELLNTLNGTISAASMDSMGAAQPAPTGRALVRFQALLLRAIGYAPSMRACVACGRARPAGRAAWFSSSAGGVLCSACAVRYGERRRVAAHVLDTPQSPPPREWFDLLDYHLMHIAGRPCVTAAQVRASAFESH